MKLPSLRKYPLSFVTGGFVVLLSVLPFDERPDFADFPLADKWTHMVMYGGLALVIWGEYLWRHRKPNIQRAVMFGYLAPVALGATMELVQGLLPYRSCDIWDFIANTLGATLTTLLGLICAMRKR